MFAKRFASAVAAALVVGLVVVGSPGTASASDVFLSSSSGKSAAWYNDAADSVSICDQVNGDGDGARASVLWNGSTHGYRSEFVFNGCLTVWNAIPDGAEVTLRTCDWVWLASYQSRQNVNCVERTFTA